jgi:Ca2+-transporting ATPase
MTREATFVAAPSSQSPWGEDRAAVVAALGSHLDQGLSKSVAAQRLEQYGPNVLRESKRRSRFVAFLMQFADWMIALLAAAAITSAAIGEWQDSLLIAAIVLANGIIGFIQEQRAEKAVAALKKLVQPTARVWRDGTMAELSANEVVPGDLAELRGGDLVPADGRLLETNELQADESPLTGESMGVDKQTTGLPPQTALPDRTNMVYAGTAITRGIGKMIVTATGMQTELGKIAALLETAETVETPLQRRLAAFSKRLAVAVVAVCALVFALGLWRGEETAGRMFLMAVSLAVAAVPEGLPAVITIALALGSQRMSRRKAIVRQLAAVETLGSVNVICSDKTGTLTQNKMSVSEWAPHRDEAGIRQELIRAAVLCNDAQLSDHRQILGSATETAIVAAAMRENIDVEAARAEWPRLAEFPFSSARKRMSAVHRSPQGATVIFVKGAAETILERSSQLFDGQAPQPLTDDDRRRLDEIIIDLTGRGRRVLGAARRDWPGDRTPESADEAETELVFLGFVGLVDPPRPEARNAIARCRTAGIRPTMITGDHRRTALAIAKELALCEDDLEAFDGEALEKIGDDELRDRVARTSVFARVSPEHKLRIVRAHQSRGSVVSMTGDGVNDAPALKQADIGVAMGINGTDVSKEAARMVLADDNFATIVAAVEEGRVVYDNIRKFVQYLLTANLSEILLVLLSIVLGLPLPLLPIHLLWINLVTDGLPALALAYERAEANLMRHPPRRRDESIFAGGLTRDILIFGTLMGVACLGLYIYFLRWALIAGDQADVEIYARTAVFVALAMFQLFYVLGLRTADRSIFRSPPWENWRLVGAVLAGAVLQIAIVYLPPLQQIFHTVPLRPLDLLLSIGFSTTVLIVYELTKAMRRPADSEGR